MLTIAILTPLALEQRAIMAHLSDWKQEIKNGDLYHISHFKGLHHSFRLILRQTGSKNSTAALAAERIIQNYQPNILFLTGIAGGVKDTVVGDIVVGTKAYGYDAGKEQTGGFVARPEVYLSSKPLILLAELVNHKKEWQNRTTTNQAPKEAFFGPIAAGDKVIAAIDQETYSRIKTHYNDTIAVEMEAHGVGYTLYNNPSVYWINIRGVSDLLKEKNAKTDMDTQPLAAAQAAAFLFEMLYQLNAEQLKLQIMDIKTITGGIITALTPFLQKSKSIKTITKDISEASDTTLSGIWTAIKPIFIEEFEEEEDVLTDEATEASALNHVLKKKLKKEEGLKEKLEALLKEREAKQPTNSAVITNSKNVISGSTINAGGDFHLGDKTEIGQQVNNYGKVGQQVNVDKIDGDLSF